MSGSIRYPESQKPIYRYCSCDYCENNTGKFTFNGETITKICKKKEEYDSLITRAERAEELLHKALKACEFCSNRDGVCGKTCSIKDIKEWKEAEG